MTKKIKTINIGLPKPNTPNPFFLATMDGGITPNVMPLETVIDLKSTVDMYTYGPTGLMTYSAVVYTIKGLDLTKPFTLSFDYNVIEDSYVGAWTGIVTLGLKDRLESGNQKAFSLLTTDDSTKTVNNPTSDLADFGKYNSSLGWMGSDSILGEYNKYHTMTFINDGENLCLYFDGELKTSVKILSYNPIYEGVPDLQLAINTGHNNNGLQRYPISNLYISKSVVLPNKVREHDELVLPSINQLGAIGNCEYTRTVKATLPYQHISANNKPYSVCGDYMYEQKNDKYNLSSCPSFRIRKSNANSWSTGDKIGISGIAQNNIIKATPSIKFINEDAEIDVVGTWSRLDTNYAEFTIGENANIANKDLFVEYSVLMPKVSKPTFQEVFDDVLMATNGEDVFYCNTTDVDTAIDKVPYTKLISDTNPNAIYFNKETGTVFRDEQVIEPLKIKVGVVEFRDSVNYGLAIVGAAEGLATSYCVSEFTGSADIPKGSLISDAKDYHLIPIDKMLNNKGAFLEENNPKEVPYINARVPFSGRLGTGYNGVALGSRLAKITTTEVFKGNCVRPVLTRHMTTGELALRCYIYDMNKDLIPRNTVIRMFNINAFEKTK